MDLRNLMRDLGFRKPRAWRGKTKKSRSNSRSKAHEVQPVIHPCITILTFDVSTTIHSHNFVIYFHDFCNEERPVINNFKK